jgi:hypothetical protein
MERSAVNGVSALNPKVEPNANVKMDTSECFVVTLVQDLVVRSVLVMVSAQTRRGKLSASVIRIMLVLPAHINAQKIRMAPFATEMGNAC